MLGASRGLDLPLTVLGANFDNEVSLSGTQVPAREASADANADGVSLLVICEW